jgi:hypothetical protein
VWTPKRILLLVVGFALFLGAYLVYAHFLGGVDGLKPLPDEYGPIAEDILPPEPVRERDSTIDEKLRLAFGDNCPELKRKTNLEIGSRGMVLSIGDFKALPDGRVELTPFSLAIFGKAKGDAKSTPEINTVQCQVALLTFDRPVANPGELVNRKIVAGELRGDIYLINNRRTPQRDDDISVFTRGPLFYQEARNQEAFNRIWTDADVKLVDLLSKPEPMTITGTGMDIQLTNDSRSSVAGQTAPPKRKTEGPSGVDWVRLRKDVVLNLWVDARSGFLGSGKGTGDKGTASQRPLAAGSPGSSPADKSEVVIRTRGPFTYDVRTDRATFEMLQTQRANFVTVDRIDKVEGKLDSLACEHLEVQFRRKSAAAGPRAAEGAAEGLDVETARATGKEVVLTSDAEFLEAHGTDFFYDKRTRQSILKGSPRMWALKEGNEIHANELQLLHVNGSQQATALGEGFLSTLDKQKGTRTLEARWKKKLIYGKDGPYDLLTLYGDAAFDEKEQGQHLEAEVIKVWLESNEQTGRTGSDSERHKPHHLEAVGRVKAHSPDMIVNDTERLVLRFKDVPATSIQLPAAAGAESGEPAHQPEALARGDRSPSLALQAAVPARQVPALSAPGVAENKDPHLPTLGSASPSGPNSSKPKKPIELSARLVITHVLRAGNKNELDKLWCEGTVRVHQEPSAPGDKGVDIQGGTLELTHHVDGNVLAVTRDTATGKEAHVQLDKLFILGPLVNIDQTTNESWVNGEGVMRMPSKASFDGTALARETELTVSWAKGMVFNGQRATFKGAVQATQDNGRVVCDGMQVILDRKVSLREGNRGDQSAKVQKLVCERDVWIEDSTYQGRGQLVSNKRIHCPELVVDNDSEIGDSKVDAAGPGVVRIFQLGTKGELFPQAQNSPRPSGANSRPSGKANGAQAASQTEQEFKLTYVSFVGKMIANNKRGMATFYDQVVAIHVPTDNPNLPIDEDRPPPDSIRLSCYDKLEVLSRRLPDGRTTKEMTAYNKVTIVGPDFAGNADVVKYDESKDQVILEGSEARPAMLDKQEVKGGQRQRLKGRKIIYCPGTGEFQGDSIRNISFPK